MTAFEVPFRTRGGTNAREHHMARHRRVLKERQAVRLCWPLALRVVFLSRTDVWVVTLTRIAPRKLDDDNLRGNLKGVRDEVAAQLGLRGDADPRVRWEYAQTPRKPREYAVRVELEPLSTWAAGLLADSARARQADLLRVGGICPDPKLLAKACSTRSTPAPSRAPTRRRARGGSAR